MDFNSELDIELLQQLLKETEKNDNNLAFNVFLKKMDILPGSNKVTIESLKNLFRQEMGKSTSFKKVKTACKDIFSIHDRIIYINKTEQEIIKLLNKKPIESLVYIRKQFERFIDSQIHLLTKKTGYNTYLNWCKKERKIILIHDENQFQKLYSLYFKIEDV